VVRRLCVTGRRAVVLDDLSTGIAARVPAGVPLTVASVTDRHAVRRMLVEHDVEGVIHLAGAKSAPESVADPLGYYQENLAALQVLLSEMVELGVNQMVLSSSAAVYGIPQSNLVTEESPTRPINPYGEVKLLSEWLLRSAGTAYGISWVALRYFNVVGADDELLADRGRTNLFPVVFERVVAGRPVLVTGSDYPTRDGTGVRDYVHVADVADAHLAAIRRLDGRRSAEVYNVGTGRGHSVLEVLAAVRDVTGLPVRCQVVPRRPGDPPEVVADVAKIGRDLAWEAGNGLADMVRGTWRTWLPVSA
jgi:UDP-glucose 4-epimerase